jgi:hypothetical protein
MVKIWESWGIDTKYNGKREFAGHTLPGLPNLHLKYAGGEQNRYLPNRP